MNHVLSLILILVFVALGIVNLNMIIVHTELPYCTAGKLKNGVNVEICSINKAKCAEKAKEHEISSSCKETD